jgi:hypothetical protein
MTRTGSKSVIYHEMLFVVRNQKLNNSHDEELIPIEALDEYLTALNTA